jgi:hypothetical protein
MVAQPSSLRSGNLDRCVIMRSADCFRAALAALRSNTRVNSERRSNHGAFRIPPIRF